MNKIDLDSRTTYQVVYEVFSNLFLDAFLGYKVKGYNTADSIQAAKIILQDRVAQEIFKNEQSQLIIIKVYETLKNDSELVEKALRYYRGMKK